MKKLQYKISINASKETVCDTMLDKESFKKWTEIFMPGSYYEGSWEKGAKIKFLAPNGEGMSSVIAENKKYEFISIKHLGIIKNGDVDLESKEAKEWVPAFENYSFNEQNGTTEVKVDVDVNEEWIKYFNETWPKALNVLKEICEKLIKV